MPVYRLRAEDIGRLEISMSASLCSQELSQGSLMGKGDYSAARREACSNQAFAASLSRISCMTIVKTSNSYFACTSPSITAASLSSIWFQPSI